MRGIQRKIVQLITMAGALAAMSPALAQMNPIIVAGPQNYAMGRIMQLRSRQMQQQFDRTAIPQAPLPQQAVRSLAIPSDPAVTQRVHDLYVGELAQSGGAGQAAEVDRRFGNIRKTFALLASRYGLRPDTLDDVMAAHMITMWMAANQQSGEPTPIQAQAVRSQMRNVFASETGAISGAAERQEAAEYVMYETCMTVMVRNQLGSRPDLDKGVSDAVNSKMSGQGYSLRILRLTDQGLVRR
jgi:hypothetical protein